MKFRTYMKKNYLENTDLKGDLARLIKSKEGDFPTRRKRRILWWYISEFCKTGNTYLDVFNECFDEWKKEYPNG